jgi:hypothetical protein
MKRPRTVRKLKRQRIATHTRRLKAMKDFLTTPE